MWQNETESRPRICCLSSGAAAPSLRQGGTYPFVSQSTTNLAHPTLCCLLAHDHKKGRRNGKWVLHVASRARNLQSESFERVWRRVANPFTQSAIRRPAAQVTNELSHPHLFLDHHCAPLNCQGLLQRPQHAAGAASAPTPALVAQRLLVLWRSSAIGVAQLQPSCPPAAAGCKQFSTYYRRESLKLRSF